MKKLIFPPFPLVPIVQMVIGIGILSCLFCITGNTQNNPNSGTLLFDSEEVLNIRLSGNIRELVRDRSNDAKYHPITLSYKGSDSSFISLPIKAKTRGHFRRTQGDCSYPPLLLNFSEENTPKNSLFYQQHKMKLVTPCRGDKYVVREYLVYKLFNLITPKSFRARLVRVVYDDTGKEKKSGPQYGILLEEEDQMARRNKMVSLDGKLVRPEQTQSSNFLKMAVFEYLIGNTDWSVQYLQNVKLIATDSVSTPSTVPYDFDHAGIVGAPYAKPAEALQMNSIRERRYRGYCMTDLTRFDETLTLFKQLEKEIYGVYTNCSLVEDAYKKATTRFLDEFYKTINDPRSAKAAFSYPCNKDGTGNVVIKGLDRN